MKNENKNEYVFEVLNNFDKEEAAKILNVSLRTIYRLIKKYNINKDNKSFDINIEDSLDVINNKDSDIINEKKSDIIDDKNITKEDKKQIKELSAKIDYQSKTINKLIEVCNAVDLRGNGSPDFLEINSKRYGKKSIPTLFCSDEHWGEVVKPEQINFVNEYSTEIARKRYNKIIDNYLDVVFNHLKDVDHERMVLALGGDNVSGDIHDELSLTNDMTLAESIVDYIEHKEQGIKKLLSSGFKQIFIPCVRGNHDRLTEKTHSKNILETSSAYIVYNMLKKIFKDDKRIVFSISKGIDCMYKVHNHKMLLTHGDQFKGGNGIGGISVPILRGFYKKLSSFQQCNNEFDSMVIGHFHQYNSIENGRIITNGSLKGYDEYSQKQGYQFQKPTQAFWLTHPERGITIQLPIFAEDAKENKNTSEWVSWVK